MGGHGQDALKTIRPSLRTVQRSASDGENIVGRQTKSLKHHLNQEANADIDVKRKHLLSKETQASIKDDITTDDLTTPHGTSKSYWQKLAETRRVALKEALDDNEKLHKINEDLREELAQYKQMLEEANSFVEIIKEELANGSNNDTGIDVNDVSSAENTADDDGSTLEDNGEEAETSSKA